MAGSIPPANGQGARQNGKTAGSKKGQRKKNGDNNNSTNLTICDLSGRVVMQQGFNATSGLNNQVVDVTGLNTGIYLLNVGGKTSKLIIE